LSHDALAVLVGTPRPNLIAYEKGRRVPGAERLVQLAAAVGLADPLELTTATAETVTLADLRVRAGLDVVDVARRLGVDRSELKVLESGAGELTSDFAAVLSSLLAVPERQLYEAHRRSRIGGPEESLDVAPDASGPRRRRGAKLAPGGMTGPGGKTALGAAVQGSAKGARQDIPVSDSAAAG
jgi:transcriptional regulator with XRE-family HTH domain